MPKIDYKFADGHTEEIEVSSEIAAFLNESDKQERLQQRRQKQNCVSLELLKNRERRVLQSGRYNSRDKLYRGTLFYGDNSDPYDVLEKAILEEEQD